MGISPCAVVWVANRENPLAVTVSSETLKVASNGNLELVYGNHNSLWSTNVDIPSNKSLVKISLDNGNLVHKDIWHIRKNSLGELSSS